MHELDEVLQFILDSLGDNDARGHGSVVSIRIAPYIKKDHQKNQASQRAITPDDVLDAHEALEHFDGDFRKLFSSNITNQ